MTTALAPTRTTAPKLGNPTLRVTQLRIVRSEWTKFRSLRSTIYTLGIAGALVVGLSALFSAITANQPGGFNAGETATTTSSGSGPRARAPRSSTRQMSGFHTLRESLSVV